MLFRSHRLAEALSVLEYMVMVEPESASLWRDRGLLHYRLDSLLAAESDLRRYFLRSDRLHLFIAELDGATSQRSGAVTDASLNSEMALAGVLSAGWMSAGAGLAPAQPRNEERGVLLVVERIRKDIRRLN